MLRYLSKRSLTCHVLHPVHAFHYAPAAPLRPKSIHRVTLAFSVTPSLLIRVQEYLPVFHPLRLSASRSRLTQGGRTFPWNPWAFGVQDSHLHLATHTGILTSMLSTVPSGTASSCMQRSPTTRSLESAVSVVCLAPVHFRRRVTRLVSCYALFEGWLLLSQPPSCLCIPTSFST